MWQAGLPAQTSVQSGRVRSGGEGSKEGLSCEKKFSEFSASMICAKNILVGGGLWAKNGSAVCVVERTMEDYMLDGVSDGVLWATTWAGGDIPCVGPESVGIFGVEAVASGELDGGRQDTSLFVGEGPLDEWWGVGVFWGWA